MSASRCVGARRSVTRQRPCTARLAPHEPGLLLLTARGARWCCGVQGPGTLLFVPSGWHHTVTNLEDTLSINHSGCEGQEGKGGFGGAAAWGAPWRGPDEAV